MGIYISKDLSISLKSCGGKILTKNLTKSQIFEFLSAYIELEEGFTLRDYFNLIIKHDLFLHPRINQILSIFKKSSNEPFDNELFNDVDLEYISIIPGYNLWVKNNIVSIEKETMIWVQIQTNISDDYFIPIMDYMLGLNEVLNLELRIENKIEEFNDLKFILPSQLTLIEFLYCVGDNILDTEENTLTNS